MNNSGCTSLNGATDAISLGNFGLCCIFPVLDDFTTGYHEVDLDIITPLF
jgi:hypothetical protein